MSTRPLKKSTAPKIKSLTKAELLSRVRGKDARLPTINGAFLEQDAIVLARLGVSWYNDAGEPTPIALGDYMAAGQSRHYHLINEGVPDGSVVSFYLDISAAGDEVNQTLFLVDSGAQYESHWRATGTLGFEILWYIGLDPVLE